MKKSFTVTGMTCSACSAHVEKAVRSLDGTKDVSVNLLTNTLKLEYDESKLDDGKIISAVISAGYGVADATANNGEKKSSSKKVLSDIRKNELSAMKKRFFFSILFLIPLMFFAMGHMFVKSGFLYDNLFCREMLLFNALIQLIFLIPILYLNRWKIQL